jgi:exonuclease VII small subunit
MWMKENDDMGLLGSTETLVAYEEAMKEFATSAAEFLEHIALLTKARDAYQRAIAVSTQLRDTLDRGDETLRALMAQVEQAVNIQPGKDASDKKKPEAVKVETIEASGGKADAARA